jgi:defect-in-organelle-trafficking protein DotC
VRKNRFIGILILALALAAPRVVRADDSATMAPQLEQLHNNKKETPGKGGMPFDIRNDAQKQAALSYGARGGLAFRTYTIRRQLEARASYMDKVFDFRELLIPAPSGHLIEPPVISEEIKAMLIDSNGTEAAVADRVYDISVNAHIVGAARSWRNYVERDWGDVTPPPDQLRPANDEERRKWKAWVREGWDKGLAQADAIFDSDLAELTSDYQGMIRYRMLLAQGMVTPPYALQTDRGVTGGGKKMRVGDRDVQLTGMPALISGSDSWQPASR